MSFKSPNMTIFESNSLKTPMPFLKTTSKSFQTFHKKMCESIYYYWMAWGLIDLSSFSSQIWLQKSAIIMQYTAHYILYMYLENWWTCVFFLWKEHVSCHFVFHYLRADFDRFRFKICFHEFSPYNFWVSTYLHTFKNLFSSYMTKFWLDHRWKFSPWERQQSYFYNCEQW